MKSITRIGGILLILVIGLGVVPSAQAASFSYSSNPNGTISVDKPVSDDAFVAGNTATVNAPVGGEIFATGSTVQILKSGDRSIFAVGSTVTVNQGTAYDTFIAGSTVTLSGTYGHDVYVAGGTVTITPGTVIAGDLRLVASEVTLGGKIGGNVYVVHNTTLTFTGGTIAGSLNYTSPNRAVGLDKVTVANGVHQTQPNTPSVVNQWLVSFIWSFLAALIIGILLVVFKPKTLLDIYDEVWGRWAANLGIGLLFLILVPIATILLISIVVGWQVALILLAAYIAFLILAHVIASLVLGRYVLQRSGYSATPWMSMLVGLAGVSILTTLPFVGIFLVILYFFLVVLPTLGTFVRWSVND